MLWAVSSSDLFSCSEEEGVRSKEKRHIPAGEQQVAFGAGWPLLPIEFPSEQVERIFAK